MNALLFLILFSPMVVCAQTFDNWNKKSNALLDSIKQFLPNEYYLTYKEIINNRNTFQNTAYRIDSIKTKSVKIVETLKFKDSIYGIKEEYHDWDNKIRTYLYNGEHFGISSFDTDSINSKKIIDTIYPRNYFVSLGCQRTLLTQVQSIYLKAKVKFLKRKVKEDYIKIETLFDSKSNVVYISFRIPVKGKRKISIGYGMFITGGLYLEEWFE